MQLPYGEPAWLATRYQDVKVVLSDPRFSRWAALGRDEPRTLTFVAGPEAMINLDPPEHSRLRRLVTHAFTMRRIDQLRPRAQAVVDHLIDGLLERGSPVDLVEEFALPFPITVICELLGVPVEDRKQFRGWSDAFLSTTAFSIEQVADSYQNLLTYISSLLAQRRKAPTDDLLGALVSARDDGDRLTEEELLSLAIAILVAGHETTATQIPNFLYVLLQHPDQLAALREDPALVAPAIEELLRYTPLESGSIMARYAVEDVELGGTTVRAGEPVIVALISANRDESVYPDADVLDLTRKGPGHVGFGHGAHHCLGAPLARMELQVGLATLLRRLPGVRLAGTAEDVEWKVGVSTRGLRRMTVRWD